MLIERRRDKSPDLQEQEGHGNSYRRVEGNRDPQRERFGRRRNDHFLLTLRVGNARLERNGQFDPFRDYPSVCVDRLVRIKTENRFSLCVRGWRNDGKGPMCRARPRCHADLGRLVKYIPAGITFFKVCKRQHLFIAGQAFDRASRRDASDKARRIGTDKKL